MSYDLFAAVDSLYRFPPEVRAALAESIELRNTVIPMTQTQRNNLTGADLWNGRMVVNTTTGRVNRYNSATTSWKVVVEADDIEDYADLPRGILAVAHYNLNQPVIVGNTDLTGLSVPVTLAEDRILRISGHACATVNTASSAQCEVNIHEGATRLARTGLNILATGLGYFNPVCVLPVDAGVHTFKLMATANGATSMETLGATAPEFIMVEDLGPA